ncbi:unnamed protein product [Brassica rapa subsp. trilocularis]
MSSMMETLQIRKQVSLLVSERPTSSATISLKSVMYIKGHAPLETRRAFQK